MFLSCILLCIAAAICYTVSLSGSVSALLIQQQLVWQALSTLMSVLEIDKDVTVQVRSVRGTPAASTSQKGLKQLALK